MNAALVNAIAERMWRCWEPLKPIEQFVIADATAAAEAVADFVAALPHGYTAPDVLAAIRGEDVAGGAARAQLTRSQAADLIRDLLDRVLDEHLPEARMEDSTAWFGGHGYVLGSGVINGVPGPTDHRRSGIGELFEREAAHRLDAAHWAAIRDAEGGAS